MHRSRSPTAPAGARAFVDERERVVRLTGELDLASAAEVEGTLGRVDWSGPVEIDLSRLTFMDSTGLATLLRVAGGRPGRVLILRRPQPVVGRVLDLARVDLLPLVEVDHGAA